ncbi:hypothetical protein JCM14469_37440 [Desulfatiferula olefinivorans]
MMMATNRPSFARGMDSLGVFRAIGTADRFLLAAVGEYLDLSVNDGLTVRDLADMAGRPDDPALQAVLLVLLGILEQGSLCLDLDPASLAEYVPEPFRDRVRGLAADFSVNLDHGAYADILTQDGEAYLPLVANRGLLYFQKFYAHEHRLKARIAAFVASTQRTGLDPDRIDALIDSLYDPDSAIRTGRTLEPVQKDPVQLRAIRLALQTPFSIISGGPGTGKTSLMVTILRALVRSGADPSRIILGAPTGRAAQRMTEAVQTSLATIRVPSPEDRALLDLGGATLHKILKYNGRTHDFHHHAENPLPASVIVLDEVSMVDLVMLDTFLSAVDPERTRLVFLGDKDQLPSVEAGSVFADMIPDGTRAEAFRDRLVILENVYRSGARLLSLAKTVNRGEMPEMSPVSMDQALAMDSDHWAVVPADHPDRLQEVLRAWAESHYLADAPDGTSFREAVRTAARIDLTSSDEGTALLDRLFDTLNRARILTLVRNGEQGCLSVNDRIGMSLRRELDPQAPPAQDLFSGRMIIITKNDYAKDLFNGDVGMILKDVSGLYQAFFKRSNRVIRFPVDQLPAFESAFAVTVHKSQGSEFDDVLLILPPDPGHRLLTREIVYTGMTRAKRRFILYAIREALETAVSRRITRRSGLGW